MTEQTIESDVVYDHDKYGEVLVTSIAEVYDEVDVGRDMDEQPSREVLVFFYDQYDGYGGMNPMPLTESLTDFVGRVSRVRAHDSVSPLREDSGDDL